MPKYRYRFTISATNEGGIEIDPVNAETATDLVDVTPSVYNIIDTSRKLIADLERQLILDGVAQMVSGLMPPTPVTPATAVKEALQARGIVPDAPLASEETTGSESA